MRLTRRTESESGIPTSSMADIAFLLIIFFMVTSVFSATKGLELKLPTDERKNRDPEPAVFIHIRPDRVLVDCRPMQPDEILPYLEPKLLRNPNKPVILYTDSDAEYRRMVSVYDVLVETEAGDSARPFEVKNIFIPTRSEIDEYMKLFGSNPLEIACAQ
jgi:biopolymer transport protein ExbD